MAMFKPQCEICSRSAANPRPGLKDNMRTDNGKLWAGGQMYGRCKHKHVGLMICTRERTLGVSTGLGASFLGSAAFACVCSATSAAKSLLFFWMPSPRLNLMKRRTLMFSPMLATVSLMISATLLLLSLQQQVAAFASAHANPTPYVRWQTLHEAPTQLQLWWACELHKSCRSGHKSWR